MFQNYNPNMKTRKLSINGSPGNFSFLWSSQVIRRSDNLSRCISSRLSQAGLNGKRRAKKKIWPSPLFLDLSEGFNIDERVHKAEGREICAARPSDAQRTPEKHVI